MYLPILKAVAGRRKKERFKGAAESSGSTTRKKGQHRCDICQGFGHHWNTCKNGDPADIAAMLAERGPPKKKKKQSTKHVQESIESSIIVAGSTSSGPTPMCFPPSQASSKLSSGRSVRSGCDSSQPEPLSIEYPLPCQTTTDTSKQDNQNAQRKGKATKTKAKKQQNLVPPHSPAMCTRSKAPNSPASPAMSTRSKRKILD
ncbi:hypothetical protein PAHAL_9G340700 [Panicum hallii]|uniref:Uncharacterized protein n=1 Tax=Panicum hallii TaxID=206008 RepID=A0A2T8I3D2_9POAL|nr:uncharacterized protein LOC112875244 isoform X1 [Panicum hallii]XP_025794802.1 uncharacterized protein LOC112875244 isoform X1 [Panicum hallii]PVH32181.1 hypothetical protein PAHAL_9G340700 [Panicum hallii]